MNREGSREVLLEKLWSGHTALFNPFLFIRNKLTIMSSEGFSALEKNVMLCSQRAMLPIKSCTATASCRLKWLVGAL
jgi:hypothetical protein